MTQIEALRKSRKKRRKDILKWYRFIKYDITTYIGIEHGVFISFSFSGMPSYGAEVAARLLVRKNNNYVIVGDESVKILIWKFKEYKYAKMFEL